MEEVIIIKPVPKSCTSCKHQFEKTASVERKPARSASKNGNHLSDPLVSVDTEASGGMLA